MEVNFVASAICMIGALMRAINNEFDSIFYVLCVLALLNLIFCILGSDD